METRSGISLLKWRLLANSEESREWKMIRSVIELNYGTTDLPDWRTWPTASKEFAMGIEPMTDSANDRFYVTEPSLESA